jgi:hypothetical protein
MTPTEFIDGAFAALDNASSITTDEYFNADPLGITYVLIALREISVEIMSVHLEITFSDASRTTHDSQGPDAWQQTVARALLTLSPIAA